ncbi:hypothetical protein [Winogradskyella wichelsiae]|uniref:hypothetical protein n=1 Tax=Winogradskyella wichelsiae TaxID=2697007 RepID=UPI003EF7F0AC
MKIIDTFVPCLFAFKYTDDLPDELERVFDDWEDPVFLNDFFEENENEISITIEEAIVKVKSEAVFLRNKLLELANSSPNQLNELFKNLNNNEYTAKELSQQKARNRWLRLYAIKIDENNYVITGGAIKFDNQHLMQHNPHTNKELIKINKCRDYLKEQGVYDADSFQEIFF